jgi:hypothetical protein
MTKSRARLWGLAWLAAIAVLLAMAAVSAEYGAHLRETSPTLASAATGQVVQTTTTSRAGSSPPFFVTYAQWWLWTAMDVIVWAPVALSLGGLAWGFTIGRWRT